MDQGQRTNSVAAKNWQEEWTGNKVLHKNLMKDPTQKVKGFKLPQQKWVILYQLRIGFGRCGYMMYRCTNEN